MLRMFVVLYSSEGWELFTVQTTAAMKHCYQKDGRSPLMHVTCTPHMWFCKSLKSVKHIVQGEALSLRTFTEWPNWTG
jgi:hypothetical protein